MEKSIEEKVYGYKISKSMVEIGIVGKVLIGNEGEQVDDGFYFYNDELERYGIKPEDTVLKAIAERIEGSRLIKETYDAKMTVENGSQYSDMTVHIKMDTPSMVDAFYLIVLRG